MTKGQIVQFCQHVYERQSRLGIPDAFRFVQYHDGKAMATARYVTDIGQEVAVARASKQRDRRKTKAKHKGGPQLTQNNIDEGPHHGPQALSLGSVPQIDPQLMRVPHDDRQVLQHSPAYLPTPSPEVDPDFAIDPALLTETVSNGFPREGAIVPRPMVAAPSQPVHHVHVTHDEMNTLISHGHSTVLPINGPNDGAPLYEVQASATELLGTAAATHTTGDSPTGTQATGRRKAPKRGLGNADKQTIEEGKRLGKRPITTRANPGKRRG